MRKDGHRSGGVQGHNKNFPFHISGLPMRKDDHRSGGVQGHNKNFPFHISGLPMRKDDHRSGGVQGHSGLQRMTTDLEMYRDVPGYKG
ncbi:hypothetical protein DPMN_028706 [Dreissena polymorpha]|uniref:Uncharacterized protein n=1 Tax=Dreissena polymorpha TaxID=45954 RepID=A0A9D4RET2_DREPO|nr:hypothetical protein DPMN_028706 [Dreissena polymorpha]